VSPGQPNTKPDRAELEAAIDALLAEIDTTCTKFENPQSADEDEDLAEYTKAMAAAVTAPPPPAPPLESTAGETDGPSAAGAEAEQAIGEAEAAADDLLEAAADQLIESLEAEVADAGLDTPVAREPVDEAETEPVTESVDGSDGDTEPEPVPESDPVADTVTNDDLLGQALDGLLDEAAPEEHESDQPTPETEPAPAAGGEAEPAPAPVAADAFADLDAAFDELLEGSFESADGEAVDTAGVDTRPDRSLMLDPSGGGVPESAPKDSVPEPAITAAPAVEAVAAAPQAPETVAVAVAAAPVPAVATTTPAKTSVKVKPWKRAAAVLGRVVVWARPRVSMLGGKLFAALKPLGAKVLVLMSKPLEGKPPRVRDSIGWVAIWTLFLGLCVWAYAVLRPAPVPANDGRGTQVVTAETPAE
jgi:hypothetical protein